MLCLLLFLADDPKAALSKRLLSPRQAMLDVQDHVESRLPRLPAPDEAWAKKLRADLLAKVVLRGEAARWDAKGVEYGDTLEGVGYSIRKLRYEALPGMWIPALLYVPAKLADKVPVMLAVNGHDRAGKAADYKQTRCINLAKRGMIVLNAEWFGMGQLRAKGWEHASMNGIDLCGTSGLAPFYLSMKRGLDVLLAQPKADPARVAVSGLSGGGWQTIWISALDERVALANPVAGYSPFKVKIREWFKDLGDSEQAPTDFASLADYTHLTALRAPRPTLLTYNGKDDCCFEAGYALPPLMKAARPFFDAHKKGGNLRSHVNDDPGDHNFGKDNREALYRAVGDFFYPDDPKYVRKEIECAKEVRKPAELEAALPKGNVSLNGLALALSGKLKRPLPESDQPKWQQAMRKELAEVLRLPSLDAR
ncbi:MAG: prolyl oligopeptidase family serine peptidase, partial [Gemmataceae bacterium]|nr:prolyl oligopeptidase family serine peptidase [Gemmataceae bacterium]